MNLLFFYCLICMLLSCSIVFFSIIIGGENNFFEEYNSMFECGYDSGTDSRMPFSLHFFLVILLFIIFDMEILLLLPASILCWMNEVIMCFYLLIILIFIYFSLIYEWIYGCLDWL